MTTHEDNSVCIDQIDKDLVHDEHHDLSVPVGTVGPTEVVSVSNTYSSVVGCGSPVRLLM